MRRRFTIKTHRPGRERRWNLSFTRRSSFYVHVDNLGLYWSLRLGIARATIELHYLGQLGRLPLRYGWWRDSGWREYEHETGEVIVSRDWDVRHLGLHYAYRCPPRKRRRSFRFAFGGAG